LEYEDRLRLRTPEGVDLDLVLAGMGSRMLAGMFDLTTQGLIVLAYALIVEAIGLDGGLGAAGFAIVTFLAIFGYDVAFEVLARGRTPGKRIVGLRVMRAGGQPIGFVTSAIRNVLRIVDILPFGYGVGVVVIFVTRKNQRLGDLVAGSVVVRERLGGRRRDKGGVELAEVVERHRRLAETVDVSAITADEVATVRRFLDRRSTLTPEACDRLAHDIARTLEPRVGGLPPFFPAESLLELIVAAKAIRRGEV
jgi:uncharacterized RDD family membrane protein YckC